MRRDIELLAPGGDVDSIKAAVAAGADAIYCGLDKLNARHRAQNISLDELHGVIALAHRHSCKVFLTLNIVMVESDLPILIRTLNHLANTNIDGVIVQDLGLLHLLQASFPGIEVHASTQLTTHNEGQVRFLQQLSVTRVNLCRELNVREIRPLARVAHDGGVEVEVFVHGSYCLCFSGICYMSSAAGSNSGNRGKCSQPCRDRYVTTPVGKNFPLNLKDNSAYFDLELLADAGADAFKIEGRMKNFHFVYTVTSVIQRRLQSLYRQVEPADHSDELHVVFNRSFSDGFLAGDVHREMFSDNPRNHAADTYREKNNRSREEDIDRGATEPFDEIANTAGAVKAVIDQLSTDKQPAVVSVSGKNGAPLCVSLQAADLDLTFCSDARLAPGSGTASTARRLDRKLLQQHLRVVGRSRYRLERLDLDELERELFLPFKELNAIKKQILSALNDSRQIVDPVAVPTFQNRGDLPAGPTLSVLLSSAEDLDPCAEAGAQVHLQLPNDLERTAGDLAELLAGDRRVIPWFPSILAGRDFGAAVRLLRQVRPTRVVTNNTGVALEARREGIPWIAGPQLNITNTLSLLCLRERFDCHGAFLSDELSRSQLARVVPPEGLELYYRIFHPMMLLTSRQCLFHQVTGCHKVRVDQPCVADCERSTSITNMKGIRFLIHKARGHHASIYHETHQLNTEVLADFPRLFHSLFVDLRDIATGTRTELGKVELIRLFSGHLRGDEEATERLAGIQPTTNIHYQKGI